MKNANHRLFYRLFLSALVCFQALTAWGGSPQYTIEVYNEGITTISSGEVDFSVQYLQTGNNATSDSGAIQISSFSPIPPGGQRTYTVYGSNPNAVSLTGVQYQYLAGSPPGYYSGFANASGSFVEGTWYSSFTLPISGTAGQVVTNPPCTSNVVFSVQNNSTGSQWFYQATAGGSGQTIGGGLLLPAGGTGTSTATWPCDQAGQVQLYACQIAPSWTGGSPSGTMTGQSQDDGASPVPGATPSISGSGGGGGGGGGSPPTITYQPPSPTFYNPTNWNATGSNADIIFSGTNTDQQGFSALYDAATKAAAQAHSDAQAIDSTLVGMTNLLGSSASGVANAMAVSNAIVQNGLYVSNALAHMSQGGTNVWVSNLGTVTNSLQALLDATITNGLLVSNTYASFNNGFSNVWSANYSAMTNTLAPLLGGVITNGLYVSNQTAVLMNGISNVWSENYAALTNSLAGLLTNGLTYSQYTNGLAAMGETNGLTFSQFTNGLAMLGDTNAPQWTNAMTFEQYSNQMSDYQLESTDNVATAYAEIMANTNQAGRLEYATASTPATFNEGLSDSGGGGASVDVIVGSGSSQITYTFANENMPTYTGMRTLCYWCIVVTVFVYCWKTFEKRVQALFLVPQATSSGQEFAGFNATLPGAISMASLIVAAIGAFITMALSFVWGLRDTLTGMGSDPFTAMRGGFAWQFLTAYVPLDMLVSGCITVIVYRIFISSLASVCAGVVKFLVGP